VTIEREQKRVKNWNRASTRFDLTYTLLHNASQVKDVENASPIFQGAKHRRSSTRQSPKSKHKKTAPFPSDGAVSEHLISTF
jgi:hypothetical protein